MKIYRCLCRKCSDPRHPEYRNHAEEGNLLTCLNCGLELFITPMQPPYQDEYTLEEQKWKKTTES